MMTGMTLFMGVIASMVLSDYHLFYTDPNHKNIWQMYVGEQQITNSPVSRPGHGIFNVQIRKTYGYAGSGLGSKHSQGLSFKTNIYSWNRSSL